MKLRGKKEFLKLSRKHGVMLVLHGHYLRSMEYPGKGMTFLNAGGSVLDELDRDVDVNLIRISPEGVTPSVERARGEVGYRLLRRELPVAVELEQAD